MKCNILRLIEETITESKSNSPCPEKQFEYDRLLIPIQEHYAHELSKMPKRKVLDVGCAYGTQSVVFSQLGHTITALDNMPELSHASWLKRHNIDFQRCNIETDEIEGEYDMIIMSEVIEHLCYNPVPAMERIFKALRPGGILLLSTPMKELYEHRHSATGKYINYLHYRDIPYPWNGYQFEDAHHYLYQKKELVQLVHEVGFEILECYPIWKGRHHYLVATKPVATKEV